MPIEWLAGAVPIENSATKGKFFHVTFDLTSGSAVRTIAANTVIAEDLDAVALGTHFVHLKAVKKNGVTVPAASHFTLGDGTLTLKAPISAPTVYTISFDDDADPAETTTGSYIVLDVRRSTPVNVPTNESSFGFSRFSRSD